MNFKPFFLIFLAASAALASFGLKPARHVNPEEIPEEPLLPKGLIAFYSSVLDLSMLKRYDEAVEELSMARFFYMPENLKFIISRFNELLADAAGKLGLVESHIEEAEALIEVAKLQEARGELKEASRLLSEAERSISNIESSITQLANALGVEPKPLLDKSSGLKALAGDYARKIEDLLKLIEEMSPKPERVKPELTIQTSALRVWLGERLIMNGSLRALSEGLAYKPIRVYFDGVEAGRTLTDAEGKYSIELQIPYVYKHFVTVFSVFTPSKGEAYAPCSSSPLTINLLYYEPELSLSPVQRALPGRALTVYGRLSLNGRPIEGHTVNIRAFGEFSSTLTNETGEFKFDLPVPPDAPVGKWLGFVEVPPRGLMAPVLAHLTIEVEKIKVKVEAKAPSMVFAGSKIAIKGQVDLEDAEDLTITVEVEGWRASTRKIGGGPFAIEVYTPLTASTGNYAYSISVEPNQPWLSPASTGGSIFILNPLTLLMPILAVSMAVLTARKVKGGRGKVEAELPKVAVKVVLRPPVEGLATLYWEVVRMVSARTGVSMEASHTIREYLRAVASGLKEGFPFFERLSLIYEKLLYARWVSVKEEDEAKKAYLSLKSLYEGWGEAVFCLNCGEKLPPKVNYCDKCGEPVYREDAE